jgi:hypothetical protein
MKDRKVLAREIAARTVLRFVKLSREGTARASSDFGKPAPGLFSVNPCTHSGVGFGLAPFYASGNQLISLGSENMRRGKPYY